MAFNLIRLHELCKDKNKLLEQLCVWKLIPREGEYNCFKCGGSMKIGNDNSRMDGFRWRCDNTTAKYSKGKREKCETFVEFRCNTFFARSKLPIFKILGFVNLWVDNASLSIISKQLDIDLGTAVDWASFCREVVLDSFIINKEKLGGPGKIVEIDESKFGKRKYHKGHHVEGQWVFGGYERGSGKVFMVCVEER